MEEVFLGTFASNELNINNSKLSPLLNSDDDFGLILNYSTRNDESGGTHWVALAREDGSWYYFDPYGIQPISAVYNFLNNIKVPTFMRNTVQLQEWDTDLCGYYCIEFLKSMLLDDDSFAKFLQNMEWGEELLNKNTNTLLDKYS